MTYNDDEILTAAEVAAWLRITVTTLGRYVKQGILPQPMRFTASGSATKGSRRYWQAGAIRSFIEKSGMAG